MENIDTKKITSLLDKKYPLNEIVYTQETDSTNNLAKREHNKPDKTLFIADIQTAGRGRNERIWVSDNNSGLWMSLLLKPDIEPQKLSCITLVAGVSVVRAMKNILGKDVHIKWPNDIVLGNKKLSGILCEGSFLNNKLNYAVLGIGINLNQEVFDKDLENIACSVKNSFGKEISREDVCAEILNCFWPLYHDYLENGMKNIILEYKKNCITLNKEILVINGNKKEKAYAHDLDNDGHLIIKTDNGIKTVSSGEVSVRGIFGYM